MSTLRVKRSNVQPLSDEAAYIVLRGWHPENPEPAMDEIDEDWNDLYFFDRQAAPARFWTMHETYLRAFAAQHGIRPAHGALGDQFYGEACAAGRL